MDFCGTAAVWVLKSQFRFYRIAFEGAMTLEVLTLEGLTLEVFFKKTLEAPKLEAKSLWRARH